MRWNFEIMSGSVPGCDFESHLYREGNYNHFQFSLHGAQVVV